GALDLGLGAPTDSGEDGKPGIGTKPLLAQVKPLGEAHQRIEIHQRHAFALVALFVFPAAQRAGQVDRQGCLPRPPFALSNRDDQCHSALLLEGDLNRNTISSAKLRRTTVEKDKSSCRRLWTAIR